MEDCISPAKNDREMEGESHDGETIEHRKGCDSAATYKTRVDGEVTDIR